VIEASIETITSVSDTCSRIVGLEYPWLKEVLTIKN